MTYSSTMVSNNVLQRVFADGDKVTPMKLQKILYFVASEYAKETGEELFPEPFQTWSYGPVLYSVFDEFRPFSKREITRYARGADGKAWTIDEAQVPVLARVVDRVWRATKPFNATQLSRFTHAEDSAWDKAYQRDEAYLNPEAVREDTTYRTVLGLA